MTDDANRDLASLLVGGCHDDVREDLFDSRCFGERHGDGELGVRRERRRNRRGGSDVQRRWRARVVDVRPNGNAQNRKRGRSLIFDLELAFELVSFGRREHQRPFTTVDRQYDVLRVRISGLRTCAVCGGRRSCCAASAPNACCPGAIRRTDRARVRRAQQGREEEREREKRRQHRQRARSPRRAQRQRSRAKRRIQNDGVECVKELHDAKRGARDAIDRITRRA